MKCSKETLCLIVLYSMMTAVPFAVAFSSRAMRMTRTSFQAATKRRNSMFAMSKDPYGKNTETADKQQAQEVVKGILGGILGRAASTMNNKDFAATATTTATTKSADISSLDNIIDVSVESSVEELIKSTNSRAQTTLATTEETPINTNGSDSETEANADTESSVQELIQTIVGRAGATIASNNGASQPDSGTVPSSVDGLIESVTSRAQSTLAAKENQAGTSEGDDDTARTSSEIQSSVQQLVQTATKRASSTIASNNAAVEPDSGTVRSSVEGLIQSVTSLAQSTLAVKETPTAANTGESKNKSTYRGNPAIANTALAHTLWETIIEPGQDSAIDATCGNGHDSLAIAKMLFGDANEGSESLSHLLCVDIQQQACESTQNLLMEGGFDIDETNIEIVCRSHAPLPRPTDATASIALVVYNLGFLPQSDSKNLILTSTESTIESLVDALLLVRVGGMVSVMTYPNTNAEEDSAARLFLECAALLSSNVQTWQEFMVSVQEDGGCSEEISQLVVDGMERLVEDGSLKQTWRVSEHRKLGMARAPILITATKIK